tara:strand:+ start:334 stop:975 length:642 start_codon:yes stop_codon:yes gene_type:complete
MKYLVLMFLLLTSTVYATDNSTSNQTNTSGSNTSISGGYTSTTTNNNDGQTNTTTSSTSNATTSNTETQKIPVGTANAPSMSSYSQDLCTVGVSAGVQLTGIGVAAGSYFTDENCERMKLGKLLYDFNMRVAAIAILCQDDRIFSAMHHAGTPCPFEGQIGAAAKAQWKKYDVERPDYNQYIKNLRRRATIDARLEKVLEKRVDTAFDLYGDE